MSGPIIVTVRKKLIDALKPVVQGTAGMSHVSVVYQYPTGNEEPAEIVWTQNAQLDMQSASLRAGRNYLNESSSFDLVINTSRPGFDVLEAAQRVIDIGVVVVEWIGDHKNGDALGIDELITLSVAGAGTQDEVLIETGVAGRMQIPITYTARLT